MGMGHMVYAFIFLVIMICANLTYNNYEKPEPKLLRVTIPEDLDYNDVFTDIFTNYLSKYELTKVKTTNLGSMFKLTYEIELIDKSKEKEFLDQIRVKNGNLEVGTSTKPTEEL
jgi:hypothetical protein